MIATIIALQMSIYIPEPYMGFWDTHSISNSLIQKGYEFLNKGRYDRAYEAFNNARMRVWDENDLFAAYLGFAIASFYTGRADDAMEGFRAAYTYATDVADSALTAMWNVYVFYQWAEYDSALILIERYKEMIARYDPTMLGLVYISVNMPDSAVKYVRSGSLSALYIRGYAYFLMGYYEEAAKNFEKCVDSGESEFIFPYAVYMLGESYRMEGQIERAAETFSKLAFIYTGAPITERAIFAAAYLYDSLGQVARADSLLDILLSWYRPKGDFGAAVKFKRAEVLIKQASKLPWHDPARERIIRKAIAMLDSLKDLPEDIADDVVYLKATAFYRIWDHYDAERLYEYGAIYYTNSEHYEDFLFGGGRSAYYLEKYDRAISLLKPLVNVSAYSHEASYYLGMAVYRSGGDVTQAERYLRYALSSTNRRYKALASKALGDIFFVQNELDSALKYFRLAIQTRGLTKEESDDAIYSIEYIRYNKGEYGSLVDFALKFASAYPDNPYTPALIFNAIASGQISKADAVELLRIVVNSSPFDSMAIKSIEAARGVLNAVDVEPFIDTLLARASDRYQSLSPDVFMRIASLYEAYGLHYKAINAYRFALNRAVASGDTLLEPEIRFYIGRNYLHLNDFSSAVAQFDTAYQRIMRFKHLPKYFLQFMESYVRACLDAGDTATVYRISDAAIRVMSGEDRIHFINFLSSNGVDVISTGKQSSTDAWYHKLPLPE